MWCIRAVFLVCAVVSGVIFSAMPVIAEPENAYVRRNLVVNRHDSTDPSSPPPAAIIDPLLQNPWGAAIRSAGLGGHFWLANAASATEEGHIAAWTEGTIDGQFGRMRTFVTVVDNARGGALYRGLAVTAYDSANRLYAANFSQDGIELYNSRCRRIHCVRNGRQLVKPFAKPTDIPTAYVPFNIQSLEGLLYVPYAELIRPDDPPYDPAEPHVERTCPGCGFVAVFDQRGMHIRTLEGRGRLNAPWGMAIVPANFGSFSRALLVGNFGDGTLVAFDLSTGQQIDYLRDPQGNVMAIDGLWAIFFGNGASLGRADFLYWIGTAGFNDETDGGFGSLNYIGTTNPDPSPATMTLL